MQKYKKFSNIFLKGYIVNVFDNLQYDIQFVPKNEHQEKIMNERYGDAIKDNFVFADIDIENIFREIDFDRHSGIKVTNSALIKTGTSYRCRLKRVHGYNIKEKDEALVSEFKEIINRNNRWVNICAGDIDVYNRILVEIYDVETEQNLNNILIQKYPGKYREYQDYSNTQV